MMHLELSLDDSQINWLSSQTMARPYVQDLSRSFVSLRVASMMGLSLQSIKFSGELTSLTLVS